MSPEACAADVDADLPELSTHQKVPAVERLADTAYPTGEVAVTWQLSKVPDGHADALLVKLAIPEVVSWNIVPEPAQTDAGAAIATTAP